MEGNLPVETNKHPPVVLEAPKTWNPEIQWAMDSVDREEFTFEQCYTCTHPTIRIQLGDAAAAIHKAKGVIITAAKLLRRPRSQLNALIMKDPDLRDFYDQYREGQLDLVEKTVFDKALEGDVGAAKFLLDRLGKKRGYATKTEIEHDVGGGLFEMLKKAQTGHKLPSDIDVTAPVYSGQVIEQETEENDE